ncbi:MAG TPA: hypothetical protein VKB76_17920, partial [Ktedonobacterales bacterium]|nr:hypothetical protein [Ktedonobacterales bacterium]
AYCSVYVRGGGSFAADLIALTVFTPLPPAEKNPCAPESQTIDVGLCLRSLANVFASLISKKLVNRSLPLKTPIMSVTVGNVPAPAQ